MSRKVSLVDRPRGAAPAMPLRTLALAIGLTLGLAGMSQAQSLKELYDAAREHDPVYRSARALAESAPFRAAQAEALLRPSVSGRADLTNSRFETGTGVRRDGTSAGMSVSARQPLFNRGDRATVGQAQRQLDVSRYDLEIAEQDLILRVSQAYFDYLAARDAVTTTGASKAAINEQLASAKRNFEVGTATITDTREAQARYDLAVAQEILALNDVRQKRVTLEQLVGRAEVEPKGLATPVVLPPLEPGSMNDWIGRADQEHPAIRRAQLALDVARLETEKAEAGHLPSVDAVASISGNRQTGSIVSASSSAGNNHSMSMGVQMSVPIFSGYSVTNRVKETQVLQSKARRDVEAARRTAIQATQQAYLAVQSGLAQVKALEAAESSTQLALDATQLGYKVGVRVNLDVLNAQTQLYTTRRDLARARYDVLLAGLRLRQASGYVEPADLASVSRLLAP